MKKIALGFTLMLTVSSLFAWSFGSNNSDSGFSFGNQPNSGSSFGFGNGPSSGSGFSFGSGPDSGSGWGYGNRPRSGSSWGFGNGPNSGSSWNENFNDSYNFNDGFSFSDGFSFGDGFNSGWRNRNFGNNYYPYQRRGFHRMPGSGFSLGKNSGPHWNAPPDFSAARAPAWVPPNYEMPPAYMMLPPPPPPPMYYYPVPEMPKSVQNRPKKATQANGAVVQAKPAGEKQQQNAPSVGTTGEK